MTWQVRVDHGKLGSVRASQGKSMKVRVGQLGQGTSWVGQARAE